MELAQRVRATLDSSSPIDLVPYEQAFGAGFDDLRARVPHLGRLRGVVGFEPSIPLEQTIRDIAEPMRKVPPAPLEQRG